ncbi:amino acid ABC transporter substrate-binding protein [Microvirga calopogonii]|uniref:amino acid ABC transporter substrate-binding protein n=1 Tax=Microvirga calopogonii TaxID=2078013 RepID=UPI000E0D52F5|nr:amino acid ABC transporter substrate-binding protein [Microvirga calopogonii]
MVNAVKAGLHCAFAGIASLLLCASALPAAAGTLETVRQRGVLQCGVSEGLIGFSEKNAQGEWSGFDVDFCRAVAGAVFDDPSKIAFVPLSAGERFDALRSGRVDLLSRNSTWTLEREAGLGLAFAGITYHDGQGFLVMRDLNVSSALELDRAKVCVEKGTTSQLNLADFFRANSMTFEERAFPSAAEALSAFQSGQCNVLTRDQSALYAERLKLSQPGNAIVLPDVISKEPLGPATRADDFAWFNIVKWVNFALVNAEELGISSQNVAEAKASTKPAIRRFVGLEGGFGGVLGLDNAWALNAVRAAGNFAEIYERNLGVESRLGIPRGMNQLWSMGGVLYAPPIR